MRRIEEHKRPEDYQLKSKGKAPTASWYHKDPQLGGFQQRPWKEARGQNPNIQIEGVNVAFKKLVNKILEKIKHEPYFRWPGKIGGDPTKRN